MSAVRAALLLALVVVFVGTSVAEVPRVVSYQGRLTIDGTPVEDGTKSVRFIIWDDPTSILPANEMWNSGPVTINTVDGLFSVNLGEAPMAAFPEEPPSDTGLWLGITVGAESEMAPRTRLTSSVFAFRAAAADEAELAHDVDVGAVDHGELSGLSGDDHPQYLLADGSRALTGNLNAGAHKITNLATATSPADAVRFDQVLADGAPAGGDLTGSYPNPTLASNSVSASQITTGAVYTSEIADYTIVDNDINTKADIDPTKILGTAVNLTSTQTVTGDKRFDGTTTFGDSTMTINNTGIRVGDVTMPSVGTLLSVERTLSTSLSRRGINCFIVNDYSGDMRGISGSVRSEHTSNLSSYYGVSGMAYANGFSRRGVYGYAQTEDVSVTTGTSYGVFGIAYDGAEAIGVYGSAASAEENHAGYFSGDINVTGSVLKSGSFTLIDHPDNPAGEYIQYGTVESPELKVVIDGTVVTGNDGKAEVVLPDWYGKVTEDYRYQLTVIGSFARAIVSEKISDGRFVIATDESNVEVCWQVTGVRSDVWAKANAVKSVIEKKDAQRGLYRHPALRGQPDELSEDYVHRKAALEERQNNGLDDIGN